MVMMTGSGTVRDPNTKACMEHMMRSLGAAVLLITVSLPSGAQTRDASLREHIVHEFDELGQDIYRDGRITNIPDTSICFIYVGRKQTGPLWARLQVRYASYRPLNITKIKFSKGDKALEFEPAADLMHQGNNGMIQWEWYDSPPSDSEIKVIQAIIAGPGVKLTLFGRERTEEREISELERLAMENVLEQARLLGRNQ